MENWLKRTELLIGAQALSKLKDFRVAVIGLGGVGFAAAEALCRSGIGHLLLVDHDTIDITNLNRQLIATCDTIGMGKAETAKKRLGSISPNAEITAMPQFYTPDNHTFLFDWRPDYIIDAIDTVTAKLDLVCRCKDQHIPLITCLGTGNRLDPSKLQIGDISETARNCGCGLARVMRRELRKRGILHQPVLYSQELPLNIVLPDSAHGRHAPGSIAFVPPVAGYLIAAYVVNQVIAPTRNASGK